MCAITPDRTVKDSIEGDSHQHCDLGKAVTAFDALDKVSMTTRPELLHQLRASCAPVAQGKPVKQTPTWLEWRRPYPQGKPVEKGHG